MIYMHYWRVDILMIGTSWFTFEGGHISTQVQCCSYHVRDVGLSIHVCICIHRCTELWL